MQFKPPTGITRDQVAHAHMDRLGGSMGLAEKHFKPIEIEAKKIKEAQRSNLTEKLKAIEQ